MKIWIYLNGVQQGPYTLEQFAEMGLPASTPVWYEGLEQWMPAADAPATAAVYGVEPAAEPAHVVHETVTEVFSEPAQPSVTAAQVSAATSDEPPCPPTYLLWSVIAAVCCCTPGGIVAIVFSLLTTSNYRNGDYQKAVRMSERAEWAIILSIVLGLVTIPIVMALSM